VLAVVGLVVDSHLGGDHRGGHPPTRGADHLALSSGLVSPPDAHWPGHHVVAGSGMGVGPSPDNLDRPTRTQTHPDPHDPPTQDNTGHRSAHGCDGPRGAPCHGAPHRRAEPGGSPTSLTWGRCPGATRPRDARPGACRRAREACIPRCSHRRRRDPPWGQGLTISYTRSRHHGGMGCGHRGEGPQLSW
jgi:hypothetical protein